MHRKINLLKIDFGGTEKQVFKHSKNWINLVNIIIIETHDRILPGCLKAVDNATNKFVYKYQFGENTF